MACGLGARLRKVILEEVLSIWPRLRLVMEEAVLLLLAVEVRWVEWLLPA